MAVPLADHIVRVWRRTVTLGELREEIVTYQVVIDTPSRPNARVTRSATRVARDGPGFAPVGIRRIYMPAGTDLQPRDLVELVDGPEAPAWLEVDSEVVRPRGHHVQADCRPWKGNRPTATSEVFAVATVRIALPPVRIVRPNNTVPYSEGDVWGEGADARIALPVPALYYPGPGGPTEGVGVNGLELKVVRHRDPEDVVPSQRFRLMVRPLSEFTTVLADNEPLVLSDEEIADVMWGNQSFQLDDDTDVALRPGAGHNGRGLIQTIQHLLDEPLQPGGTIGLYLQMSIAFGGPSFTPLPREAVDLYPTVLFNMPHYYFNAPELG